MTRDHETDAYILEGLRFEAEEQDAGTEDVDGPEAADAGSDTGQPGELEKLRMTGGCHLLLAIPVLVSASEWMQGPEQIGWMFSGLVLALSGHAAACYTQSVIRFRGKVSGWRDRISPLFALLPGTTSD